MNAPIKGNPVCRVTDSGKAPSGAEGSATICKAVEQALAAHGVMGDVSVEVTVRSRYSLAATITRGGRALPELTMDISDRALTATSIKHFADSVAKAAAAA